MTASKCLVKMSQVLLDYREDKSIKMIDEVTFDLAMIIRATDNDVNQARYVLYLHNAVEVTRILHE